MKGRRTEQRSRAVSVPSRRKDRVDSALLSMDHCLCHEAEAHHLNQRENNVATYLDQQAHLSFWHANRTRKDHCVQGWKPRRICTVLLVAMSDVEERANDNSHQVFVVETKGVHLKEAEDAGYKRSIIDLCSGHAHRTDWIESATPCRTKVGRFEFVDEDEWQTQLNGILLRGRM